MQPPKIAIVVFGLPRYSALTTPSIEKNVITPLSSHAEVKLFHYLYVENQVSNPWTGENCSLAQDNYDWYKQSTGIIESPARALKTLDLVTLEQYGDAWNTGFVTLRNVMLQLRAMQYAKQFADAWKPEIYIFLRADLIYQDPFEINVIDSLRRNQPVCALPAWQWWDGYNDRFALCNRAAADAYADRVELASSYCSTAKAPLHTERLLRFALKRSQSKIMPIRWRAARVRANGHIVIEDYSDDTTISRAAKRTAKRILKTLGLYRH